MMSSKTKVAVVCAVLIGVPAVVWVSTASQRSLATLTYSQFLDRVRSGQMASVVVMDSNSGANQAIGRLVDGKAVETVLPANYRDAMRAMQDKLVNVEIRDASPGPGQIVAKAAPFLLLLGIWVFLMIRKFPNRRWRSVLG